jgi:hypothetical protein
LGALKTLPPSTAPIWKSRRSSTSPFAPWKTRISLLLATPIPHLDKMTLKNRLREIGESEGATHGHQSGGLPGDCHHDNLGSWRLAQHPGAKVANSQSSVNFGAAANQKMDDGKRGPRVIVGRVKAFLYPAFESLAMSAPLSSMTCRDELSRTTT